MCYLVKTARARFAVRSFHGVLALLALAALVWVATVRAAERAGPIRVRLQLVENTAEGPAFDRCTIEGILKDRAASHWRIFYGEAQPGLDAGWKALRASSGCVEIASEATSQAWTVRGSAYLLADITVQSVAASERGMSFEVWLDIQTLTSFAASGTPIYEERKEKRTLQMPVQHIAVIPILIANQKETDELGLRELLLKFRADGEDSGLPVEYGEISVAADVPRAKIFLDGGIVGRTSAYGPVVLGTVRTGEREVVVQDASGREARSVARVEKGRRAGVSFALLKGTPAAADGLRPVGRNPQGGDEFWREKDGAFVVRIPGGEFQMGSPDAEGEPSEHPRHTVRVQDFLMDKTEVTWGQYKRFLEASRHPPPKSPIWGMPEALPVSNMTWKEASAFCAWAGGRLPTEAEWERAARGDDARRYPWGDTFEPWRCNTRDGGPHAPTPAADDQDCVSPYGILDLTGSVSEWCSDWYDEAYYATSPADNPTGPANGKKRVSRGGNWMSASVAVRTASRLGIDAAWAGPMQGFRCVQEDGEAEGK